ncbi:MAG: hypothetical protein HRU28_05955 [Rhizobiales bacterium]|nr:hypothetical protein [Hyphomicrobiales bacterium]
MSWCRILDDDGRMWAMTENHPSCPNGVLTISSNNFDGTQDLLVCAGSYIRFTTNGSCPSSYQTLQTSLSVGGSVPSVPPSAQPVLSSVEVFLIVGAAASLYGLVYIFKLARISLGIYL